LKKMKSKRKIYKRESRKIKTEKKEIKKIIGK
jgi:hypothetical protein